MRFETRCARGADDTSEIGRPSAPPIVASTHFAFDSMAEIEAYYESGRGFLYARYENPTVRMTERRLAELEGAEDAALFSSGMAAISTSLLCLAKSDDRVAAQREIYGGTAHLLLDILPELGIEILWLDRHELDRLETDRIRGCRVLYLESPVNPTLDVVDIRRLAAVSREAGATVVVDSTFATPANQRPLELGADLVIHSGTKYLGGHGDLMAGAVAGSSELVERVRGHRKVLGGILDPFQAFLLHRGMRTLAVRMQAHERGAREVAQVLSAHPRVSRVLWPGLASHPRHELARRQMTGFGGMVTFEVVGGAAEAERVLNALQLFSRAPSLGNVESLASIPARLSHRYIDAEEQLQAGVTPGMIRLSVGLESPDDLVEDLQHALS